MEPFVQQQRDGAPELYTIACWESAFPGLTVGFTGRGGGVSVAPYRSFNLGLHVDDHSHDVIENRRRLADRVGIPLGSWTYGEQVHGCEVQIVEKGHAGRGTITREDAFQSKDAFITADRGIVLAGLFADCVPLFFMDPEHHVIGLAHAGWKGTVLRVAEGTIKTMSERFNSRPEVIRTAIGPSIGGCCYEVDDRIISRVRKEAGVDGEPYFTPLPESGKFSLNLKEINRQIMIKAGILPNHIEMTMLCTGCNLDRFFSHRTESGITGRMAAWIGWK